MPIQKHHSPAKSVQTYSLPKVTNQNYKIDSHILLFFF